MRTINISVGFLYFLFLSVLMQGCNKEGLWIRVENNSTMTYNNVRVNPAGNEINFGDLAPGERSAYKQFEMAYRYAYVKLIIEGKEYILQPIDYVGETPLSDGQYTYIIGVADLENQYGLTIDLGQE